MKNLATDKIRLYEEDYPIVDGLKELFPTLIGSGMKYFELKSDSNGVLAKSDKPLKVRKLVKS